MIDWKSIRESERRSYWAGREAREAEREARRVAKMELKAHWLEQYKTAIARLYGVIRESAASSLAVEGAGDGLMLAIDSFRRTDPFFAKLESPQRFWEFFDTVVRLKEGQEGEGSSERTLNPAEARLAPYLSARSLERVWKSLLDDLACIDVADLENLGTRITISIRRSVAREAYWIEISPSLPERMDVGSTRKSILRHQIRTGFSPPSFGVSRLGFRMRSSPTPIEGCSDGALHRPSSRRDIPLQARRRPSAQRVRSRTSRRSFARGGEGRVYADIVC